MALAALLAMPLLTRTASNKNNNEGSFGIPHFMDNHHHHRKGKTMKDIDWSAVFAWAFAAFFATALVLDVLYGTPNHTFTPFFEPFYG